MEKIFPVRDIFGVETFFNNFISYFFQYGYLFDAAECSDHESEEIFKIRQSVRFPAQLLGGQEFGLLLLLPCLLLLFQPAFNPFPLYLGL